jgi:predicted membrane protein
MRYGSKLTRNAKSMMHESGPEHATAAARALRTASFLAALAISAALMLFPFMLNGVPASRLHAALPIMLLGVTGALVHGIGYRPDHRLLRMLFRPICAWLMISGGMLSLFA